MLIQKIINNDSNREIYSLMVANNCYHTVSVFSLLLASFIFCDTAKLLPALDFILQMHISPWSFWSWSNKSITVQPAKDRKICFR